MALDFPTSPTNGQKYPASPVAGVPTYTWDGEKWTTAGAQVTGSPAGAALPLMDVTPALVGTTTSYSREDHRHPVDTSRAPFDALAYSGMQINGSMDVSQELGAGTRATPGYMSDGWVVSAAGTMAFSAYGSTPATGVFPGFQNCAAVVTITAQASIGANDNQFVTQYIEGYRVSRLQWGTAAAQPLTIGFWTAHHRAGLYSVAVRNGALNRSYVTSYTQAVADVAQYNVVTIPGDTSGTWAKDNLLGLFIVFTMAAGTTYTTAPNVWTAGNFIAATGQINAVAATSDVFRLTGVIALPGNEAPSAARSPFIMRSFDQELATCRRYFWRRNTTVATQIIGTLHSYSATLAGGALFGLQPEMRSVPTVTYSSAGHFGAHTPGGGIVIASTLNFYASLDNVWLSTSTFATGLAVGGAATFFANNAGAWIQMDSRL